MSLLDLFGVLAVAAPAALCWALTILDGSDEGRP